MAEHLDPTNLRAVLESDDAIRRDPFGVLSQLSKHIALEDEPDESLEFVLLALERRLAFGSFVEVLDALVRQVGLFPYVNPANLSERDLIALEYHRPLGNFDDRVFHRVQAEVYRRLLAGENVILSAPTSFGKSLVIDAMIASEQYRNIVVIVPTLALIDETRRRFANNEAGYKVITHSSQMIADRNIFVLTQERALGFPELPPIDFFVIDEFYKLGEKGDDSRTVALNQVFYRLRKSGAQFYLLGPSIEQISETVEDAYQCIFIKTNYRTVLSRTFSVETEGNDIESLVALCKSRNEPTLVYCRSPARANEIGRALIESGVGEDAPSMSPAAAWLGREFHPDWIVSRALRRGIGIHHGKLPRSLAQYVVRAFNDERLRYLVCTSTLIEGVNTKAKNVVIFDNRIARTRFDYFTFNNIKGRSGRMFEHFVGNVFLFHKPPDQQLPLVDFPVLTQGADVPTSLLVQLDKGDLSQSSMDRVRDLYAESVLPLSVLRANATIPPEHQIELAANIEQNIETYADRLNWNGLPSWEQRRLACELIWEFFVRSNQRRSGVSSGSQLALKLDRLRKASSAADLIVDELDSSYGPDDADTAVENVLDFARTWASFEFPRMLSALSRVQAVVLERNGRIAGDYSFYASQSECLFQTPVIAALEEYGLPIQLGGRLKGILGSETELDIALQRLRRFDETRLRLSPFESEMIQDVKGSIQNPVSRTM